MGLATACPDLARTVRQAVSDTKVEGQRQSSTEYGPWFRCRLDFRSEGETVDAAQHSFRRKPNFLCPKRAKDRTLLDLQGTDVLEIKSREFGGGQYRFDGFPTPLRKRKTIIGWEGRLVKVQERSDAQPERETGDVTGTAVHTGTGAVIG
jgi:hypothetical protein